MKGWMPALQGSWRTGKASKQDVVRVMMVTGDNNESALKVAHILGIAEVHAQQLPEQKHAIVQGIEADTQNPVVMVSVKNPSCRNPIHAHM